MPVDDLPPLPELDPALRALFANGEGGAGDALGAAVRRLLAEFLACPDARTAPPGDGEFDALPNVSDSPIDPTRFADEVLRPLVRGSGHTSSPRCLGHMTGAVPSFHIPLAGLVAALNQNVVKAEGARLGTPCERRTLSLLHRLVYSAGDNFYRAHTRGPGPGLGMMASGGSLANLAGLWCARKRAGVRGGVILASELRHYSIDKAADLLGLEGVCPVAVDAEYRLRPDDLEAKLRAHGPRVVAVVGVAGATVTGSVDPLGAVAELASRAGVWFHVDAAWGGGMLLSPRTRGALAGVERSDSVVLDAHKQFYVPIGLSALLLRDPRTAAAIQYEAGYMLRDGSDDLGRWSVEGSRPWTSLLLYAALHLLGWAGYAALAEQSMARARLMAELVRARRGFELVLEPQTPQVVYRLAPPGTGAALADRLTVEVQERQRERGVAFVSRSTLPTRAGVGPVVLRAVLTNPLTARADLEAVLDEQEELARWLLGRHAGDAAPTRGGVS